MFPYNRRRIIFLFSDTGGGHRSAAEAIIEALNLEYPSQFVSEMVDVFRQYAPRPLDLAPEIYPPLSRMPEVWELGYRISDGRHRTRLLYNAIWPYVRRYIFRLLHENPCDLIVSVHPLVNAPVLRSLKHHDVPFATVVTDLVSTHAAWFDTRANLIIVPTEQARKRGLEMGLRSDQMKVIGLPVSDRFCQPKGDPAQLRTELGWPQNLPMILLVGGGDGMGPIERVAQAINQANLNAGLVIVTGRNQVLKKRLEKNAWQIPTYVYGFVTEMPAFMRAANILVTKAGPGTISEAFIADLPMILYSRIPGQEDGNVSYVINEKAGEWAPDPDQVVKVLTRWLNHPEELRQAEEACRRLARPDAARAIAHALVEQIKQPPVT